MNLAEIADEAFGLFSAHGQGPTYNRAVREYAQDALRSVRGGDLKAAAYGLAKARIASDFERYRTATFDDIHLECNRILEPEGKT